MNAEHIPAGSADVIRLGGAQMRVLLSTRGLALFEETTDPHAGPPLHVHHHEAEFFRVLEGRYRFRAGEDTVEAGPGDTLLVPAGMPHCFINAGDTPGRLFMGFQPGGAELFFRAFAAEGLKLPGDEERVAEMGSDYGLEFLGPNPLAEGD